MISGLSPKLANLSINRTDSPRSLPPPDPRTNDHDSMFRRGNHEVDGNAKGSQLDPTIQSILLNNIQQQIMQSTEGVQG